MDNREKTALLIRVVRKVDNDIDRQALLNWAEELVAGTETGSSQPKVRISFPIPIVSRHPKNGSHRHYGSLLQGWKVQVNGTEFPSLSAAASTIAGHPVNGWFYWRYENESGNERPVNDLRR